MAHLVGLLLVITLAGNRCWAAPQPADLEPDARGRQFVGLSTLANFSQTQGLYPGERMLTSPVLTARIRFNEVVVSWNTEPSTNGYLTVEARAVYATNASKYFTLGRWSGDPAQHPRQSVAGQGDSDGDVATDILVLRAPANRLQVRLTLGGAPSPSLKFLGLSLADTTLPLAPLPPNRDAWDTLIPVPERSQMVYPNGKELCSPTTVSMLLAHWAKSLHRPELDHAVPEIAEAIYDSQWRGTGNWPFNTAYAGSFPALRAYVTRLSDVSELEAWIVKKIPVALSVDYDRLRAKGPGPNGHIVACVGFTKEGDPIINDPGTTAHVRKVFPRNNLADAWACSKNTVYLVYPQTVRTPDDRFAHWDSPTSSRLAVFGD